MTADGLVLNGTKSLAVKMIFHMFGLIQERRNSLLTHLSYIFLTLTYRYDSLVCQIPQYMFHVQEATALNLPSNKLRLRQNDRHFADDIFKYTFLNENAWISFKISLKFVSKIQINNNPALVQIMTWCRPGSKPLSEPTMLSLLMHICITQPSWVKQNQNFYWPMHQENKAIIGSDNALAPVWHKLSQCSLIVSRTLQEQILMILLSKYLNFHARKWISKCHLGKWWPFWLGFHLLSQNIRC